MERYARNRETISVQEQSILDQAHVAVAGCGGLGGHALEQLARLGIGHLTAIDSDRFEESNLNRQLLAMTQTLGRPKATVAREHLLAVNPLVQVTSHVCRLTEENAETILQGHHVVVDALDNRSSRMLLQKTCETLGIPLVHGAIAGWYGQLAVVDPGARTLEQLYPLRTGEQATLEKGIEQQLGNPAFAPGLVASLQVSEVVKLLLGKPTPMKHHVLRIDLLEMEFVLLPA